MGGPARQSADVRPRLAGEHQLGLILQQREVRWWAVLSASASDIQPVTTHWEAAEEKREDRCEVIRETACQSFLLASRVISPSLSPYKLPADQWLTTRSVLVNCEVSLLKVTTAVKSKF